MKVDHAAESSKCLTSHLAGRHLYFKSAFIMNHAKGRWRNAQRFVKKLVPVPEVARRLVADKKMIGLHIRNVFDGSPFFHSMSFFCMTRMLLAPLDSPWENFEACCHADLFMVSSLPHLLHPLPSLHRTP